MESMPAPLSAAAPAPARRRAFAAALWFGVAHNILGLAGLEILRSVRAEVETEALIWLQILNLLGAFALGLILFPFRRSRSIGRVLLLGSLFSFSLWLAEGLAIAAPWIFFPVLIVSEIAWCLSIRKANPTQAKILFWSAPITVLLAGLTLLLLSFDAP